MTIERGSFRHSRGYVLDYRINIPDRAPGKYLHVLFHGFSRIESHVPPVFARLQWTDAVDSVCLSVSDPIHNLTRDSACGWFLLGEDEFLPLLLHLRADLLRRYGLRGTVWHGLSSGGYAALKYCVRAGDDDLAFVISPHNQPTILPQWEREAAPFADLPAMAEPEVMTDILGDWCSPSRARYLHAVVSEKDSYFALMHLRPILSSLTCPEGVRAVMLRDGRGHGFIADRDYREQLTTAIHDWEAHRERRAGVTGTASRTQTIRSTR